MSHTSESVFFGRELTARQRSALVLGLVTLGAVTILLAAAIVVTYVAYDRQSDRVAELEARVMAAQRGTPELRRALAAARGERNTLHRRLTAQSGELARARDRAARAYERGFAAGKRARDLPAQFAALERFARRGFLVPGELPEPLASERVTTALRSNGYSVRWSRHALFASATDPLSVWTRQAWPGYRSTRTIDSRTVHRFVGPAGITYAWREGGRTYAVLSYPQAYEERLAQRIVTSLR